MKDDIKNLIKGVRTLHNDQAISMLCDELEKSIQFNEDTLAVKIKLHEDNQSLKATIDGMHETLNGVLEAAGEDWQDVDDLPNVIKRMRQELELKSASGYPVTTSQNMLAAGMDSEPVAVTDDELNAALQLHRLKVDGHSQLSDAFRAGFRYARRTAPQPAPVVPEESYQQLSELYHAQENRLFKIAQRIKGPGFDKYAYSPSQAIDALEAAVFGEDEDCRAAMLNQAPVKQPSSIAQDLIEHLKAGPTETISLSEESWGVVQELIANPPEPSARLRELMTRKPRYVTKPKSEHLQRAEKLAEDAAALVERVHCEDTRAKVRAEHAEWATATFGNTGPIGPLKHLSAEALEAAAEPSDLSEWADMQFLFWDAQRKAGISDEQITQAMVAKLQVNKARQWPEPKEGEPRFHIKDGE